MTRLQSFPSNMRGVGVIMIVIVVPLSWSLMCMSWIHKSVSSLHLHLGDYGVNKCRYIYFILFFSFFYALFFGFDCRFASSPAVPVYGLNPLFPEWDAQECPLSLCHVEARSIFSPRGEWHATNYSSRTYHNRIVCYLPFKSRSPCTVFDEGH